MDDYLDDTATFYAVVDIATGKRIYGGKSLSCAAAALVPGTCYGTGSAQAGATLDAQAKAKKHRTTAFVLCGKGNR